MTCTAGSPWDDLTEYYSGLREYKWQLQARGLGKLLQHSSGAELFQFWQHDLLLADDVIQRVGDSGLPHRPAGRGGRPWSWTDPDYVDGPSEYMHAVRFASPDLARRFYEEWMG